MNLQGSFWCWSDLLLSKYRWECWSSLDKLVSLHHLSRQASRTVLYGMHHCAYYSHVQDWKMAGRMENNTMAYNEHLILLISFLFQKKSLSKFQKHTQSKQSDFVYSLYLLNDNVLQDLLLDQQNCRILTPPPAFVLMLGWDSEETRFSQFSKESKDKFPQSKGILSEMFQRC